MSDKEKKSKKSNKKKGRYHSWKTFDIVLDKITQKEKEREVVNHIQNEPIATIHFLYYPSVCTI